jgi:disulfide bond formation protein DsbB
MDAALFSVLVSTATVVAQIAAVLIAVALVRDLRAPSRMPFSAWLHKHGITLAFLVALGATVTSFIFSEVIRWAPCTLCWYQRAFMVPLTVLLGLGLWWRDRNVTRYALIFALIGGAIALNHVWLQFSGMSLIPCPAPGPGVVSCDQRFIYEFGYLTIPVMSLTGFALIALLLGHARPRRS